MTVDLATLPTPLAESVRIARSHRSAFTPTPLVSKRPDQATSAWARDVIESGDIDAAITEVATTDADLRS